MADRNSPQFAPSSSSECGDFACVCGVLVRLHTMGQLMDCEAAAPSPLIVEPRTDDDDLGHIYCGRDNSIGLCGASLSGPEDPDSILCVVCADLEETSPDDCPRGGPCEC